MLPVTTTVLMAVQFAQVNGGALRDHAPTTLPAGVLGLDAWADRLLVVSFCLWQIAASWPVIGMSRRRACDDPA